MRRLDDTPIDPEIAAELDAIDATLAGEPVDPQYAEIAELALLLAAERPAVETEFAERMDRRVARRRFAAEPISAPSQAAGGSRVTAWLRSGWPQLAASAGALAAAAVFVLVIASGGGGSSSMSSSSASAEASAPNVVRTPSTAASSGATSSAGSTGAAGGAAAAASTASSSASAAPTPNGRKIIQSAQLALTTAPDRVDDVSQELFDVVGREHGIVRSSNVTSTGDSNGYAQFQLSIPSGSLQATMAALSHLQYAHVTSRTDATQDVNDAYVSVQHRLADARALRTALLKQLANATTQQQIDSLNARIHDAEASIASDLATIRGLDKRINFSQVTVSINAAFVPAKHSSGGFTLGKAAHDAGRVLTVGAGIALIALAVLVPLGLVAGLAWWIGMLIRRRRREHALDLA
jgi:Domain of unknown function (DUF4349)